MSVNPENSSQISLRPVVEGEGEAIMERLMAEKQELKAKLDSLKLNNDLLLEQMHKKYQEKDSQTLSLLKDNNSLKATIEKLRKTIESYRSGATRVNSELEKHKESASDFSKQRSDLLASNTEQKKTIDRLVQEIKEYSEKTVGLNTKLCEVQAKVSDEEMKNHNLTSEKERISTQLELCEANKKWAEDQLRKKSEELLTTKVELGAKTQDLRAQVEATQSENKLLLERLKVTRESLSDVSGQLEGKTNLMRQIETDKTKSIRDLEASLETQTSLALSYEKTLKKERQKVVKQAKSIEMLHERVQMEVKKAKSNEIKFTEENKHLAQTLQKAEEEIKSLREAKMEAKSRLALSQEFPLVTASKTEKEVKMLEIYHELQRTRVENNKLKKVQRTIEREFQRRDPILQRQKLEYERMSKANKTLASKLSLAIAERDRCQTILEERKDKIEALSKERKELVAKCRDLFQQNLTVLNKQEATRSSGLFGPLHAADVVTKNLVKFKNVEELYGQHQRLMGVVRVLSSRCEQMEKKTVQVDKMQHALGLIRKLKEDRKSLATKLEAMNHQLEYHKTRGENTTTSPLNLPAISGESPSVVETGRERERELENLKARHAMYIKEKSAIVQSLQKEIETLRERASELRMKAGRSEVEIKYSNEKNQSLSRSLDGYRKEISALRKQNETMSHSLIKHQNRIQEIIKTARSEQDKRMAKDAELRKITAEMKILSRSEERLRRENSSLVGEKRRSSDLLSTLQDMQNSLRNREEDRLKQALNEKKKAIEELETLKSRHERMLLEKDSTSRSLTLEADKARKKVETALAEAAKHKASFHEADKAKLIAEHSLEREREKNKSLGEKLKKAEAAVVEEKDLRQRMLGGDPEAKRRHQLEQDLKEEKERCQALEENLKTAEELVQKYQKQSKEDSEALRQYTETRRAEKDMFERQLSAAKTDKDSLTERVQQLQDSCLKGDRELQEMTLTLEKNKKDTKQKLEEASTIRDDALRSMQRLEAEVGHYREEAKNHEIVAKESTERYERELMMHVRKNEMLKNTQQKLNIALEEKENAEAKTRETERGLSDLKKEVATITKRSEDDRQGFDSRENELKRETVLLHSQLESLQSQIDELKASGLVASSSEGESDSAKDLQEMRELYFMMSKEKEQIDLKLKRALQEKAKYQALLEIEKKGHAQAVEELKLQAAKSIDHPDASEHKKLLQAVMNTQLLEESNATLRAQAVEAIDKATTLEKKCAKLESEVSPLRREADLAKKNLQLVQAENRSLQADVDRWKERTHQLLDRYQVVDAKVHKMLKEDHERVKSELADQTKKLDDLKKEHDQKTEQLTKTLEEKRAGVEAKAADMEAKMNVFKRKNEHNRKAAISFKTKFNLLGVENEGLKEKISTLETSLVEVNSNVKVQMTRKIKVLKNYLEAARTILEQQETKYAREIDRLTKMGKAAEALKNKQRSDLVEARRQMAELKKNLLESKRENQSIQRKHKDDIKRLQDAADDYRKQIAQNIQRSPPAAAPSDVKLGKPSLPRSKPSTSTSVTSTSTPTVSTSAVVASTSTPVASTSIPTAATSTTIASTRTGRASTSTSTVGKRKRKLSESKAASKEQEKKVIFDRSAVPTSNAPTVASQTRKRHKPPVGGAVKKQRITPSAAPKALAKQTALEAKKALQKSLADEAALEKRKRDEEASTTAVAKPVAEKLSKLPEEKEMELEGADEKMEVEDSGEKEQERLAKEAKEKKDSEEQERVAKLAKEKEEREEKERVAKEAKEKEEREEQERIAKEAKEKEEREEQERIAKEAKEKEEREEEERVAKEAKEKEEREEKERVAKEALGKQQKEERAAKEAIEKKDKESAKLEEVPEPDDDKMDEVTTFGVEEKLEVEEDPIVDVDDQKDPTETVKAHTDQVEEKADKTDEKAQIQPQGDDEKDIAEEIPSEAKEDVDDEEKDDANEKDEKDIMEDIEESGEAKDATEEIGFGEGADDQGGEGEGEEAFDNSGELEGEGDETMEQEIEGVDEKEEGGHEDTGGGDIDEEGMDLEPSVDEMEAKVATGGEEGDTIAPAEGAEIETKEEDTTEVSKETKEGE